MFRMLSSWLLPPPPNPTRGGGDSQLNGSPPRPPKKTLKLRPRKPINTIIPMQDILSVTTFTLVSRSVLDRAQYVQKLFTGRKVITVSELVYFLPCLALVLLIRPSKTEIGSMQRDLDGHYRDQTELPAGMVAGTPFQVDPPA